MINRDTALASRHLELGQKIDEDVVPSFELAGVKRDLRRLRNAA
jgi:hypothetical protein